MMIFVCVSFHLCLPVALDSSSNTSENSIMSFLSAMESRSLQAGPVSAPLLPPFRPPSWPAGVAASTYSRGSPLNQLNKINVYYLGEAQKINFGNY